MTDHTGVAAVGNSLVRFLNARFTAKSPLASSNGAVKVLAARTEDLKHSDDPVITPPCLTVFLYRVDFNKTMRAAWSAIGSVEGRSLLPLDLHYLLIPWGRNADEEYRIAGRTIQVLDETPILSGPLLDPTAPWDPDENVQICMEELTTEELMGTFDSLPVDYKLCLPYVGRIVVMEGTQLRQDRDSARADILLSAEVKR